MLNRRQLCKYSWLFPASTGITSALLAKSPQLKNHHHHRPSAPVTRIAFGSCNNQDADSSYWDKISATDPDLWVWLGDNIYADDMNPQQRWQEYLKVKSSPAYQRFIQQVAVYGTWDDHDFFTNNCNHTALHGAASQTLLMDFLDLPPNHPSRQREGIYQDYILGPPGKRLHLVLLDNRYFKDDPAMGGGLLGELQWQWLETQLMGSSADLIVLGTGINVTSSYAGFGLEGWRAYRQDRQRLYELIRSVSTPTIIISGDRHLGEVTRVDLGEDLMLYEAMSSGLTHHSPLRIPGTGRITPLVRRNNFGLIHINWQESAGPRVRIELREPQDHRQIHAWTRLSYPHQSQ